MDRDRSDLTGHMAIVAHETIAGVQCSGRIVAAVDGINVELRCNECGAVVGVVQLEVLKGLIGFDSVEWGFAVEPCLPTSTSRSTMPPAPGTTSRTAASRSR